MYRLNTSILKTLSAHRKVPDLIIAIVFLTGTIFLNSCIEDPTIPILKTNNVSNITTNSITSGGEITDDGGATITSRGVCWGIVTNPSIEGNHTTDGIGTGIFTSTISDLTPNTMYFIKAYAVNEIGIAYGNEIIFTTEAASAELTTNGVSEVTANAAISGGNITYDGDATITARGICWSTSPHPDLSVLHTTNGTGSGSFSSTLTGLAPGTTYFIRAYATNRAGTSYGNELSFITKIADVEGNLYSIVHIGSQVWMAENLRTARYNDNSSIPIVTDNAAWKGLTTPAYCWFNNDITYKPTFGALYNWYTISTGKLCPSGWHVPTDEEFNALEITLGMNPEVVNVWGWRGTDQGAKMKSTTGWDAGGNGTNSSGFNGLAGGYRQGATGNWAALGILTYWWNSTEHDADRGWYRRLDGANSDVYKASTSKAGGKYIRCIKN